MSEQQQQVTVDDLLRIIGNLFVENQALRAEIFKLRQQLQAKEET